MDADAQRRTTTTTTTSDRICPPNRGEANPAASAQAAGTGGGASSYASGDGNGHSTRPDPQESVQRMTRLIAETKEYAAYYLGARLDSIKASVRNLGVYAALGIVGLIAASAFITTVVVLFLVGIAMGLNRLFNSLWLGPFLVGLVCLIGLALGVVFGVKALMNSFRKATVNKYEQRQNWERGQFGRTVAEQAAASHNQ
jgi:hypothetical protein